MSRVSLQSLLLVLLAATPAAASEFRLTPSIALSQEVNDNIRQTPDDGRLEFVTRAQPGGVLAYQGANTSLDASYTLDYRYYARNTREDEFNHLAAFKSALRLWDDFFTLELGDRYSRVSLDLARSTVEESLLVNQTDQNIATISPYLTWHLGGQNQLKTGYRFEDIRYWNSTAIEKQLHGAFADYSRKISERFELTAGYGFSSTKTELSRYQKHEISAGLRYQYQERSFLWGTIGNSWLEFTNAPGGSNRFWNVGVTHAFGLALVTLESKCQYIEDPLSLSTRQTDHGLRLERTLERGRIWGSASRSKYQETVESRRDRSRVQLSLGGNHELYQGLSAGVSLLGERVSRGSSFFGLPYHMVATGSLNYLVAEGLTLGGSYSHISYREDPGSSTGSIEVNRGIVELRKTF